MWFLKFSKVVIAGLTIFFAGSVYSALNPDAPVGGSFVRNIDGEPPNLHPISSDDLYASLVQDYVLDTLARREYESLQWKPRIAEKWETSKDGKAITFVLRKDMKWHDGQPITAEDVKFSFDAIFEPAYQAAQRQPYYEGISKVEVIDPLTVKFHLKNTYFQNFISAAELTIVPKHIYGDVEKSKKMTRELHGSGPYKMDKFEKGQRIVLKRNPDWYGFKTADWKGYANFDTIILRFVKEEAVSFEMVKKGELDFEPLSPEYFTLKTKGDPWDKTVFKNQVENKSPKGYGFIGWNLRKEIFQDKNVRVALAHLMNRDLMNQKFRYGMSELATGPVYKQSNYASTKSKAIPFDVKKARTLLTKAGWADSDKDGVLDKVEGSKKTDFKFSLIYSNKDNEKYWTMYKEDLKQAGIVLNMEYLEWNSFLKILDEGNFDSVALGWSAGYEWDPKQIWHSTSAVKGGSNFIGYNNKKVDDLIDEARMEPNEKVRMEKLHKVYEMIADDAPYAYLFNDKFSFYANSNRISKPADTLKFAIGHEHWWTLKSK